jgi:multiple sugar transport system permease protein
VIAALGLAFNVVSFRTMFYLPAFTSGVALMILWKALYNPQTGPINAMLAALTGLEMSELPQWLASIELAKPSLMIMGFWTAIGGTNMLLYLAALSNVPVELTEAAEIDGASRWQRFVHVTWPQLAPTTFFISIVSVIGGLQGGFEQARVMTGGGPAGATTTLSYYIYTVGFQDLNFGYAAAVSLVLFGMLFCITAFNWRFGRSLDI